MPDDIRSLLRLTKCFETLFHYPRPLDGKARDDLECELHRLIWAAKVEKCALLINTRSVIASFTSAADQDAFYETFKTLNDYSANYIFDYPNSDASKIHNVIILPRNKNPDNHTLTL